MLGFLHTVALFSDKTKSYKQSFQGLALAGCALETQVKPKPYYSACPEANRPLLCPAAAVYLAYMPFPITARRGCLEGNASHHFPECRPGIGVK